MTVPVEHFPFQVDLAGVIELLGTSLYSRPEVALRELLQNAHDAVQRRRAREPDFAGSIRIRRDAKARTLSVEDDGVGLTREDAAAYLGTLGRGITGLLRRGEGAGTRGDAGLIGQFGVGLFSSFLLADRIVVDSLAVEGTEAVRWEAGEGTEIRLGPGERDAAGTTIRLHLSAAHARWAADDDAITNAVRSYADFLPVPIHLGDEARRLNVMNPSWLEPTPDLEMVGIDLEQRFDETPLDVVPIDAVRPLRMRGALYFSRARMPGFSGRPQIEISVRRMVISRRLDGLLPEWASFCRGVLELPELAPTTSREDLVRNEAFETAREMIERELLMHLAQGLVDDVDRVRRVVTWHRYHFAGAGLEHEGLREILRVSYPFETTAGHKSFLELLEAATEEAGPGSTPRLWFNGDRGQEAWVRSVFAGEAVPCVQALRSFESSLFSLMAQDVEAEVEVAHPSNEVFVRDRLGLGAAEPVEGPWEQHFAAFGAVVRRARWDGPEPVLAFPSRGAELERDLRSLRRKGQVPSVFARMLDETVADLEEERPHVMLNERHVLVQRALAGSVHAPLAAVLRVVVRHALSDVGVEVQAEADPLGHDLDWLADILPAPERDDD